MTRIKMCGLTRPSDIETVNELKPDYIGFVFARKSRRFVDPDQAAVLKKMLLPSIKAVGVFVDEEPEAAAGLVHAGTIDLIQLHGLEDEEYIRRLRVMTEVPIIQAFQIRKEEDVRRAEQSCADYILLDSGTGSGQTFDWRLTGGLTRSFFLAGGLHPDNVADAIRNTSTELFAVDVSSGIETDGHKDMEKMRAFVEAVRCS